MSISKSVNPFYRLVSPGITPRGRLFVEIDYREGRLSIVGVEGPMSNGDCRGSAGQCGIAADLIPNTEEGWDAGKVVKLRDIWERWHLNDMRSGCKHQRKTWATDEPLELQGLPWGDAYHADRRRAEAGEMTPEEYAVYAETAKIVYRMTIGTTGTPAHPRIWGEVGDALLASGYLKFGKKETKAAGWVYPSEHPDGMLTKPCEVCGYKYGSAWLKEPVPASVLGFLRRLKDTSMHYAWSRRRA